MLAAELRKNIRELRIYFDRTKQCDSRMQEEYINLCDNMAEYGKSTMNSVDHGIRDFISDFADVTITMRNRCRYADNGGDLTDSEINTENTDEMTSEEMSSEEESAPNEDKIVIVNYISRSCPYVQHFQKTWNAFCKDAETSIPNSATAELDMHEKYPDGETVAKKAALIGVMGTPTVVIFHSAGRTIMPDKHRGSHQAMIEFVKSVVN